MTIAQSYKLPRVAPAGTLRVLHVRTVRGNGGGPEKTLFTGPDYFRSMGVESEALYLLDAATPSDALLKRADDCNMPVHVVMEKSALDVSSVTAFAKLVRSGGFNIVHTHDYKSNAIARMLTPAGKYRIVATAHGYNQTTKREGCYYKLEKMLLRRADAVICPSRCLAELLVDSGVSRRRLHVIHNAIEPDKWTFKMRSGYNDVSEVIYVGRLSREKNVQALLQAFAMLRRKSMSPCRLKIVGEGPERQRLEQLSSELGLADIVEFTGRRSDVAELLSAADMFVNPSSTEAMPNSVLEAMAVGTPVIATDVGDTAELVKNGRTGTLIPPGDISALAKSIDDVAGDPDSARMMTLRARTLIEDTFDFRSRAAHVVALYRGILASEVNHNRM